VERPAAAAVLHEVAQLAVLVAALHAPSSKHGGKREKSWKRGNEVKIDNH